MAWKFELVAGPFKGRTGGLAWDGKAMLFSAVQEERILRYDPASGKARTFRKYTGRTNGIAIATDGTVFGAQEGGRRVDRSSSQGRLDRADATICSTAQHHNQPTDVTSTARAACGSPTRTTRSRRTVRRSIRSCDHASVLRLEQVERGSGR